MGSSSDIDTSIASVWQAWRAFRRGKRASRAIVEFEYNLKANLSELAAALQTGYYKHGTYRTFEVRESKRRLIAVAEVRDRVVHRLVYDHLMGVYDRTFAYHVWSCRTSKGLDGAMAAVRRNMWRHRDGWIWRADVRKFFESVDHNVLVKILARTLRGQPILFKLCSEIVESYHTSKYAGMAIGNLTSQVFANIYLNEFDRYVLHQLKPLGYVRYGDDFALWGASEHTTSVYAAYGGEFLRNRLHLGLNRRATQLQSACRPMRFVEL